MTDNNSITILAFPITAAIVTLIVYIAVAAAYLGRRRYRGKHRAAANTDRLDNLAGRNRPR